MNEGRGWLSPQEIADELGVDYSTVLRWIYAKQIKAYKFGVQWRVKREDLDQWIEGRAHVPGADNPHPGAPAFVAV
jgi:excisionase family DNA binding protein